MDNGWTDSQGKPEDIMPLMHVLDGGIKMITKLIVNDCTHQIRLNDKDSVTITQTQCLPSEPM